MGCAQPGTSKRQPSPIEAPSGPQVEVSLPAEDAPPGAEPSADVAPSASASGSTPDPQAQRLLQSKQGALDAVVACLPQLPPGWQLAPDYVKLKPNPWIARGYVSSLIRCRDAVSVSIARLKVVGDPEDYRRELIRIHECPSPVYDPGQFSPPDRLMAPLKGHSKEGDAVRAHLLSDGVHFEWWLSGKYVFEMQAGFDGPDGASREKRDWFAKWAREARDQLQDCGATLHPK